MYDKELVDKKTMNTAYSVGREDGFTEGILQERTAGKKENQKETVIAMLKEGIDINTISKCTGLVFDEVKKLQKSS